MKRMENMDSERFIEMMERYLRHEATDEEKVELSQWIGTSRMQRALDGKYTDLWHSVSSELDSDTRSEMWQNLSQHIREERAIGRRQVMKTICKIASVVLLPVAVFLAVVAYYEGGQAKSDTTPFSFVVDSGQKASMTLPDGTKVWLNSASKLSYYPSYNRDDRRVFLTGEAYFEVAKNPDKKFVVACQGVEVEALGTTFDVKGYDDDAMVSTSLIEGSVRVSHQNQSVLLAPSEEASFDKTKLVFAKSKIEDSRQVDFWRRNILYFRSATLAEIAKTMERLYGVSVEFESDELKNISFSGSIRNNSLTNAFYIISLTYPLTYEIDRDVVKIGLKQ